MKEVFQARYELLVSGYLNILFACHDPLRDRKYGDYFVLLDITSLLTNNL